MSLPLVPPKRCHIASRIVIICICLGIFKSSQVSLEQWNRKLSLDFRPLMTMSWWQKCNSTAHPCTSYIALHHPIVPGSSHHEDHHSRQAWVPANNTCSRCSRLYGSFFNQRHTSTQITFSYMSKMRTQSISGMGFTNQAQVTLLIRSIVQFGKHRLTVLKDLEAAVRIHGWILESVPQQLRTYFHLFTSKALHGPYGNGQSVAPRQCISPNTWPTWPAATMGAAFGRMLLNRFSVHRTSKWTWTKKGQIWRKHLDLELIPKPLCQGYEEKLGAKWCEIQWLNACPFWMVVCPLQSIFWEAARLPSRITNNFNQIGMDKATAGYSCTRALLLLMFPVSLRRSRSENRKPLLCKSKRGWMQILGNATHSIHSNINWNLQREWQTNICLLFQLRNGSNYKKLDVNGIQPIWTFSHGYTWPTCMQTRIRSLCFLKPWTWETCSDGRMGVSGEICSSNS